MRVLHSSHRTGRVVAVRVKLNRKYEQIKIIIIIIIIMIIRWCVGIMTVIITIKWVRIF